MKIAIITVHDDVYNLGSFLQAYAMKTFLSKLGHEVRFIETRNKYRFIAHELKTLRPVRPKINYFFRQRRIMKLVGALKTMDTVPYRRILSGEETFDLYIFGSDEIWNVNNPYFHDGYFFGCGIASENKLAYAISIGNASADKLKSCEFALDGIEKIKCLMPRDAHTKDTMQQLGFSCHPAVCDPTLLMTQDVFLSEKCPVKQKFMLVYSYEVGAHEQKLLRRFADEQGLILVSPYLYHAWCDRNLAISPYAMCDVFRQAEYVFSTTFHGTIFSVINHKRVLVLPGQSKTRDVAERLGIADRVIPEKLSYEDFKNRMLQKMDYIRIEETLKQFRNQSEAVLKQALDSFDPVRRQCADTAPAEG